MENTEGDLRKRLRMGFNKAIENVSTVLSVDTFSKVLPQDVDTHEIATVISETLKENAQEVFREVCESYTLPERLAAAESLLGPSVKGKVYPPPARQNPAEAMRVLVMEQKLEFKKHIDQLIAEAEIELADKTKNLQNSRKHVVKTLSSIAELKQRLTPAKEDADTEPEEAS